MKRKIVTSLSAMAALVAPTSVVATACHDNDSKSELTISATFNGGDVYENTPVTVKDDDTIQFNQSGGTNPVWTVEPETGVVFNNNGLLTINQAPTSQSTFVITCSCDNKLSKTFNLILKPEEPKPTITITATFKGSPISENTPIGIWNNDTIQFSQSGGENPVWTVDQTSGITLDKNGLLTIIQAPYEQTTYVITCSCDNKLNKTFNLILKAERPAPLVTISATHNNQQISENTPINVSDNDKIQFSQTGGTSPVWKLNVISPNISIDRDTGLLNIVTIPNEGVTYCITCECEEDTNTFFLVLEKATVVGKVWQKCGGLYAYFHCYNDGTATIVDCLDRSIYFEIPPTVSFNGNDYLVTRFAKFNTKGNIEGICFDNATNLKVIDSFAFQDWSLNGACTSLNFTNTQLEIIGEKAFNDSMSFHTNYNHVLSVNLPKTIKSIGEQAFGWTGGLDPKTSYLTFSTTDVNDISNIQFGNNWQPHKDDSCTIYVPNDDLIEVYKAVNNFNPHGFEIKTGVYGSQQCGDVIALFSCDTKNNTATIIDCLCDEGIFVIPAVFKNNNIYYDVTKIAGLPKRENVDGVDFSQAVNLQVIDNYAFRHWSLVGSNCNWDFSNTKLWYLGLYAFDNAMAEDGSKNQVSFIKFPNTILSIGVDPFGTGESVDPIIKKIIFTTTDKNVIKDITFGTKWQPNEDESCTMYVPNEDLISSYRALEHFNHKNFGVTSGIWIQCGDILAKFECNDADNTATMVDCNNSGGILIVPPTISFDGNTYNVTKIADLPKRESVDGVDFSYATHLEEIADVAFQHWSLQGYRCNWDFSNTKLTTIGVKAFDNAMANYDDKDGISLVKFPKTLKKIGEYAFGDGDESDPTTAKIIFTTTEISDISSIDLGSEWQPHMRGHGHGNIFVPQKDLIEAYKDITNLNPRGFDISSGDYGSWLCGNVNSILSLDKKNNTATIVDSLNCSGTLVIPPSIITENVTYKVTRIAKMGKRESIDGVDFSQARNLEIIDDEAFNHWSLVGSYCNWNFSNTQLKSIGNNAFNNAMAEGDEKNNVSRIIFPQTLQSIGYYAFGQDDAVDPKTEQIIFTTVDTNVISSMTFGVNWQPHPDDRCIIYVPNDDLISEYNKITNFNPRGYEINK